MSETLPRHSIFEDVVVLEVGTGSIAASLAGMIFADNGARVLKIEPPDGGDRFRHGNRSGFLVWNRGKESVVVDLGTDAGRSEFRALAASADVVVDALHPGTMEGWGLEYDALRVGNDPLVYCAIRGFREGSPYSHLRAYEGVIAAKVGLFERGIHAFRPEPEFLNVPVVSVSAAHRTVGSVTAALVARESLGLGQRLEVSMYVASTSYDYGATPTLQYRLRDNDGDVTAPKAGGANRNGIYSCTADNRWFIFMNLLPQQSRALVKTLGMDALLDDPRFAKTPWFPSAEIGEEYELLLMEAIRKLTGDDLTARMLANPDVCFEECRAPTQAFDHPQVQHFGSAVVVDDPMLGPVRQIGPLGKFSETPSQIRASAPRLGENRLGTDPVQPRTEPVLPRTEPVLPRTEPVLPRTEPPLAGLTILEFAYYFAVPFGLSLAASLGARVIKIEGPKGDPWRALDSSEPEVRSAQVLQGKESVGIDVKTPEGLEVLHRLVRQADAFVYGLRQHPSTLGVAYADLVKVNPQLVYVHSPGYGADGPYAHRPMYGNAGDCISGVYRRNSGYWLDPERCAGASVMELKAIQVPRIWGSAYGDGHGSNSVCGMTLMALLAKKRFGIGQYVQGCLMNSALYGMADEFVDHPTLLDFPRADPEQMGLHALYRLYRAADDWIFVAAPTQKAWRALAEAIGREDLVGDARFSTPEARARSDAALVDEIARALREQDAAYWEKALNPAGVGCAVASKAPLEGFTSLDANLLVNGEAVVVEHPTLGRQIRPGASATFSLTPPRCEAGTVFGQNTAAVLQELGYERSQIDDLLDRRVVFSSERGSPRA